ncbi:Tetratricopeptide-like helical protein [Penicillium brevicompactum]|uniref:uncharacterized protein n=1 Tax=Penicillium brevicompactum TaxID=5074 RepID=UPI00254229B6|nr:uncharacterized protein N7506_009201 [Penicillium brevicompactum]KAJ5326099.1 hypothetical protein N7506_009201 [Penicillium brevicompactum]
MSEPSDRQSPELSEQEMRAQLEDLIARAAAKDATKDHDAASELYSQATEIQAELNGELSPENADLLYAYGKSLYNVAVSKSDVLGSKVAGEPESGTTSSTNNASTTSKSTSATSATSGGLVKDAIASSAQPPSAKPTKKESEPTSSKPLFQFTGDENFVDSESEDEEAGEQGEEEDDDDDFANAFEVLDLARVLYLKKMEAAEETDSTKGKSTTLSTETKQLMERLADTHDLQAEISLEAERFHDAVADLKTVLELRNSLYPPEDSSVAECHFKLSLALEFASVQHGDEEKGEKPTIDEEMRKESAKEMERAIESCRVRMAQEEKKLEAEKEEDEDKANATKRKIANVKEIVTDMEQRLIDLRQPPASIEENDQANEAVLKGVLGSIMGQSASDQKAQLDAASKGATDLSAFVKRKPAKQPAPAETSSKRPAEEPATENGSKRTRVDDASS